MWAGAQPIHALLDREETLGQAMTDPSKLNALFASGMFLAILAAFGILHSLSGREKPEHRCIFFGGGVGVWWLTIAYFWLDGIKHWDDGGASRAVPVLVLSIGNCAYFTAVAAMWSAPPAKASPNASTTLFGHYGVQAVLLMIGVVAIETCLAAIAADTNRASVFALAPSLIFSTSVLLAMAAAGWRLHHEGYLRWPDAIFLTILMAIYACLQPPVYAAEFWGDPTGIKGLATTTLAGSKALLGIGHLVILIALFQNEKTSDHFERVVRWIVSSVSGAAAVINLVLLVAEVGTELTKQEPTETTEKVAEHESAD